MKYNIRNLKLDILNDNIDFLDKIVDVMQENNIVYSDNIGTSDVSKLEAFGVLPLFMNMLYFGSKHSKGKSCESGFTRIIEHKGTLLKMVYNSGPENFVTVEKIPVLTGRVKIVTLELLRERFREEEEIKEKLRPVISKYINDGLTYPEITKIFVDVMKEFK